MVAGDEGGLEYDMSQQTPAATDSALAAHGAAVMCNGCKAGEGGGLFTGDLSEFRHFRDQHGAGDRADPDQQMQRVA